MENISKNIQSAEEELKEFPPVVVAEFRKAKRAIERELSEDDFLSWANEGVAIAQSGFRCWKAAVEYFKATPQVLKKLDSPQLVNWVHWGRTLSVASVDLSSTYFRETPLALDYLPIQQLEEWTELGNSLQKSTRRSSSFAWRFFEVSPGLLRYLTLDETAQFINFADCLTRNWHEFTGDCLNTAMEVFPQLETQDRKSFLELALVFAEINWVGIRTYFTSGPKILSGITRTERARFLSMAKKINHPECEEVLSFLIDGSEALGRTPKSTHKQVLTLAEELLAFSWSAVIEFLKSCPIVLSRISPSGLELWVKEGMGILEKSEEAGIAYFRTELSRSARLLEDMSRGVELSSAKEVLETYCTALTGKIIPIVLTQSIKEKGIGWVSSEKPSSGGTAIFLPERVNKYLTKEENFAWYKVIVTHQAGHLEFGSFDFCFDKKSTFFSDARTELAEPSSNDDNQTDVKRFFDLFDNRILAADIFTIVEDCRVDYLLNHEYKGISKDYKKVQRDALNSRPSLTSLPIIEMFLEVLIQISLGNKEEFMVPPVLHTQVYLANMLLEQIQSPGATVEDSAEATIQLYNILAPEVKKLPPSSDFERLDLTESPDDFYSSSADGVLQSSSGPTDVETGPVSYNSPQEVDFRGDFKPELIQLMIKLKERRQKEPEAAAAPISTEALKELAEQNMELEVSELATGDIDSPQGLFVSDLKEVGKQDLLPWPDQLDDRSSGESDGKPLEDDYLSFFYDEWDFRANDYRLRWCQVRQKVISEGDAEFFETTLKGNAGLVSQVKRQFELLSPQSLQKVKRLQDGEEFDLDAVIDAIVDKKAGQSPSEKIYWRRNKTERDVSVVFLLDMSSSTIEYIDEKQGELGDRYSVRDYKGYLEWFQAQQDKQNRPKAFKRIIDLEKEGTVLLIKALETIGDDYAIYGFSGYGRENVEFYIIKDLGEEFSDKIKGRIDSISPMHGTRMGPAIRHATWKLEQQPAKSKYLFLISDGRPQDHGYGTVGLEKEYAINDTKMALLEAQWKNITPFCLTVDRAGHDYLKTMCRDMRYEVLTDIESLPKRLPTLYRRLTV